MNRFPIDVVHRILTYDGRIKYRNGKYMNQIAHDDDRYSMLENMPQITMTTTPTSSYDKLLMIYACNEKKLTYCMKHIVTYSSEEPFIVTTIGDHTSEYHFTKGGIRYSWTFINYEGRTHSLSDSLRES